jgi:multiple sugar transport system permease protein
MANSLSSQTKISDSRSGLIFRISDFIDRKIHLVMVAPAVLILGGLILYPFLFNLNLSVHNASIFNIRSGDFEFVGLKNYIDTFKDPFVQKSLLRTFYFSATTVILQLVLGMIAALAFHTDFRGKGILMPLALAPMMITPVAVGLFWRMLLNSKWGLINYLLSLINIPPQSWLADQRLAFFAIIIVQVWWGVSFVFLILLGGLSALPKEPYESAVIDGATSLQTFRYITLPLLKPVIMVVATIRIIDALREFDIIYTLTGGGPGDSTRVFTLELFQIAFERGNYGMAAAQAIILLCIILILTFGLVRALSQTGNLT